ERRPALDVDVRGALEDDQDLSFREHPRLGPEVRHESGHAGVAAFGLDEDVHLAADLWIEPPVLRVRPGDENARMNFHLPTAAANGERSPGRTGGRGALPCRGDRFFRRRSGSPRTPAT